MLNFPHKEGQKYFINWVFITGKDINQPSKAKCASGSLLFKGVNFPWKHVTKEQGAALIIAQQFSMRFLILKSELYAHKTACINQSSILETFHKLKACIVQKQFKI